MHQPLLSNPLRCRDAEPEPRGIVRNRWKGQRSGQDAVVAEPSRKEYSCHPSLQNDGNYCTAMGSRQASGMRVHQLFDPCITFIPFDDPSLQSALKVAIKIPSSST